ncbi:MULTISPECIES: phosphate ABC transporter permease subunit PstC [Methylocaldum]|jgi:phosphate transport system permease protein|uniref:phosphate ABC transporter permease subunit PstC n=1 Tax=unclassified Methylocaldum TaxID=2622260 RepID=UPI000989A9C8|nr:MULTISPECIES: phosphate ABC transporter permease subunit PstC [unclassified Methylocaldum]MBP1152902.1 phosphate transport system permease protein [Methylocaldum sp. RMAD-M]MVF24120.1 phosphate ABC transporter permease subunit PstC [Methylocaldum sp. BRCS4]
MQKSTLLFLLVLLSAAAYHIGRRRSLQVAGGTVRSLHSLPSYYGYYAALWCGIPALLVLFLWTAFENSIVIQLVVSALPEELSSAPPDRIGLLVNDIRNVASGAVAGEIEPAVEAAANHYLRLKDTSNRLLSVLATFVAITGAAYARQRISKEHRARNHVEKSITVFLIVCSTLAVFTTIGIVLSVLFESIRFFKEVPITEFLFGLDWSPQMAIREDQVGSSGAFGAVPLFVGTLLISLIAMLVAVPIGLLSAIYLSEYASSRFRATAKPLLEILAGIPTVVYGFFAALVVAPFVRDLGARIGLDVSSESALAAGLVMGIMIIPFVSSLSDDFINAVPQSLRDGAYALGATQSETIRQVIIPAALPGIVGGVLLAVSRAIGETMIVVMAAGLTANLTANPLAAVTTVTTQIVTLLVGDQEFDSPKTLAAFALGLVLFLATLALNIIALHIVRKYREQYE